MAQGVSKILTEGIKHRSTPLGVIAASTLAARRGGIAPAVKASARTNAAAAASVSGSDALMPNSIRRLPRPIQTAAGMPSAAPIAVNTTLSFLHQPPRCRQRSTDGHAKSGKHGDGDRHLAASRGRSAERCQK
jgi:hypothetical protein